MITDIASRYEPAAHYDHVHGSWRLIMGEDFHYGYFDTPSQTLDGATAALTEQMRTRARLTAGDRLLDVGCGTGRQACDLATEHGVSVLGITTSASGVAAATKLASDLGIIGARFAQRDGTDSRLEDAGFDVVWVLESSHLMRDRAALLRECTRVLTPGGRLVLCDIVRKREIPFAEVRDRREDFATLRAAFGDAHMEPLEDYTVTLERLGMHIDDATDISAQTLPTFAAWRANVERHRGALRHLLGDGGVEDFVRATHILESFWLDGTLGYGILAAVKGP
jgi:cyclopropane fatty-acyl-phospholipid synthase-like methyltransferase